MEAERATWGPYIRVGVDTAAPAWPHRNPKAAAGACPLVSELRIRRRVRLKNKQARALREELGFLECGLWAESAAVETGEAGDLDLILVDRTIHGVRDETGPFLSVRGLLAYRPSNRWVTVDMGAVRFVHNGADIMAPGITAADPALQEGDWCWIRDEKNGQPLAVGKCLMPGAAMGDATSGKAVQNVHHIGDKLWELDA